MEKIRNGQKEMKILIEDDKVKGSYCPAALREYIKLTKNDNYIKMLKIKEMDKVIHLESWWSKV